MYFNSYVYGNIKVGEERSLAEEFPRRPLLPKDLRGATVKDDNGNEFLLIFNVYQKLFVVTQDGFAFDKVFIEIDRAGNLALEDGLCINPKKIVFIGEGKSKLGG